MLVAYHDDDTNVFDDPCNERRSKFPVPIWEYESKGIDLDLSNSKLSDAQRQKLQRNIDLMRDSIVS